MNPKAIEKIIYPSLEDGGVVLFVNHFFCLLKRGSVVLYTVYVGTMGLIGDNIVQILQNVGRGKNVVLSDLVIIINVFHPTRPKIEIDLSFVVFNPHSLIRGNYVHQRGIGRMSCCIRRTNRGK